MLIMMRTKDVAGLLQINPKTLKHLVKTKQLELPYVVVGSQMRFPSDAVQELLQIGVGTENV